MQEELFEPSDYELLASLPKRRERVVVESKARNERQYWVEQTSKLLGISFVRAAVKVKGWPCEWIKDMYLQVTKPEIKNSAALWNWQYANPKK